jgi:hypothetical protein
VREACRRARFELEVVEVLGPHVDDEEGLDVLFAVVDRLQPSILVAPSPHDGHPGHEWVGRAAVATCERWSQPVRLWLWGLWADLELPTLALSFGEERMREVVRCLEAHEGELARNDYRRLVRGRAQMNASVGPERIFGFGSAAPSRAGMDYVEVLCEVFMLAGEWKLGVARWLDVADPLRDEEPGRNPGEGPAVGDDGVAVGAWLHGPSARSLLAPTRSYPGSGAPEPLL